MRLSCTVLLLCLGLLPGPLSADSWQLSSSVNYDTGKYGTPYRTDSVYIPFTVTHYSRDTRVSVTLPWLRQSSSGAVTRVGGRPARVAGTVVPANAGAESGLGDTLVRGAYIIRKDGPNSFDLSLAGSLKLPTANETKGLGTGEIDQGVGLEFAKKVSRHWTVLADWHYTIIGDPEGADYNNRVSLELGVYRPLGKDLGLTALYITRSALLSGNSDPRELSLMLARTAAGGMQYSGGVLLGLSEGSPQLGLSAGASRRF